ncbi:MAG: ABC transporter permease [Bacteroidales bacterium]|nr:ABC transporter permease [Bacteroidales bacterium]
MNAARFISRRLRFEGKIAIISIAVSFLVMILAVAISSGFRRELRNGISAISGDIQLTNPDLNYVGETDPVHMDQPWAGSLESLPGVASVTPAVYRAGIVRSGDNIHGVLFKGVPDGPDSLGVRVPSRLARMLGLKQGDRLLTYFVGERVKVRNFNVAEIYPSILSGDDNLVVFASLEDMQRLNNWSEDEVSAVEVGLTDKSNEALMAMTDQVGTLTLLTTSEDEDAPLASSALHKYPAIFSWLDLIDLNVVMILVLMTIVAGFNMISGLLILLFRNISTIGTLKSMGMTDRNISEVFLRVAANLVLKGLLIGNALALLFCMVQGKTHLFRLNPDNYFVSFVPVHINPLLILGADVASFAVILLLLLLPCLFISRVDPAKTVRAQ